MASKISNWSTASVIAIFTLFLAIDVLFGWPLLGTVAAVALLLYIARRFLKRKPGPLIESSEHIPILFSIIFIALSGGYCTLSRTYSSTNNKHVADAIKEYLADNKKCPDSLEQLVPKYLSRNRKPFLFRIWGKNAYEYYSLHGKCYLLSTWIIESNTVIEIKPIHSQ